MIQFKIKKKAQLRKLMLAYTERLGLQDGSVSFLYDGGHLTLIPYLFLRCQHNLIFAKSPSKGAQTVLSVQATASSRTRLQLM